jgi:hypothetical protein
LENSSSLEIEREEKRRRKANKGALVAFDPLNSIS